MGYKIRSISEIWSYTVTSFDPTTRQGGHFAGYIDTFLKIKQEASGWPAECEDESARMRYLDEYERVEGIRLDRECIAKNPGMRSVSKLCLNSFWGKFGQRENLVKTEVIKTRQQLLERLTNPEVEVSGLLPVNDEVLYVRWSHAQHSVEPSALANVVIASYTTAQARLKLFSFLEKLDRRVFYYDTDSVIYTRNLRRPNEYEPPTGNFLGDLTDEGGNVQGERHITESRNELENQLRGHQADGGRSRCTHSLGVSRHSPNGTARSRDALRAQNV
ncbi:uncharacterized protein LOC124293939 [Neodiprion lecontei]|uniref:Uncharacterized protein LOC124293939 n=1 Tax=Neodiprion lecontei TaxID=441921 RepID=A0ABM3FY57_NEOLC|nr:uncharacterized protein LOC124293939 [Neodiprion lecontei]